MNRSASDVLITDGHWRKTLAAVRALGTQGVPVTVGESSRLAMAAFSRYCRHRLVYPSALSTPDRFLNRLYDVCRRRRFRMLLPMEDATIQLLAARRSDFERFTHLPLADPETIRRAGDKAVVMQTAAGLGIPTPRTWHIHDLKQLNTLKKRLPYPVVIKPRCASGAIGVCYPKDAAAFEKQYRIVHRRFPFPLIQERIPADGAGFGASFLFDAGGRVKASFVHQRLREYPLSGGASTLRISVRRADVLEMGRTLLTALKWFGVGMVEFKLDPRDGVPKLLEINPRFWGSLALAVNAGVNFPYLMLRMARGEFFAPVERYRIGVQCRWLLPGDLLHFLASPEKRTLMPDFFRFRGPQKAYDILSLTDPLPALVKIISPLTFLYDPDMKQRLNQRKYML